MNFTKQRRTLFLVLPFITVALVVVLVLPSCTSLDDRTLLDAVISGDTKAVQQCIENGVDPNATITDNRGVKNSGLHLSAINGDTAMASLLIKHGARIDILDDRGRTPLMSSLLNEWNDRTANVFFLLIKNGAAIEAADIDGKRAVHHAAALGRLAALEHLVQHGCDVNASDKSGNSPLHEAARDNSQNAGAVAQTLVNAGADITALNKNGENASDIAKARSNLSVLHAIKNVKSAPAR